MSLEHTAVKSLFGRKAIENLLIGSGIAAILLSGAITSTIPKAGELSFYGEAYNTLLKQYGDTNKSGKVDRKEEKVFQEKIVKNSKGRNIVFVQIIDLPTQNIHKRGELIS